MIDKEKLTELLRSAIKGTDRSWNTVIPDCLVEAVAESLLAHGVTVQRWIPVGEPPKENGYYLCYVLTSAVGDKAKYEQMPLYWEDDIWLYRHNSYRMCRNVTHWMPLPPAPKGE